MITIKKKEKVEELFNDQTVEFDKKSITPNKFFVYYTKFNGREYSYQFHKENNEWLFGFSDENNNYEINNNSKDITYQVFNGAIQVIKQFVDEQNPEKFVFSINPLEPSRIKLYQMLIKKMESWFKSKGFSFETYNDKEDYHIYSFTKDNRIDELNLDGYKHIKNNDWSVPGNLIVWLQDHNFEEVGSGKYSKVFSSNTESFIVKMNKGSIDEEYLEFVNFCLANKGNPHLPKIGKPKMLDGWYIIFIEELNPIVDFTEELGVHEYDLFAFMRSFIFGKIRDLNDEYFENLWLELVEENPDVTKQIIDVTKTLFDAYDYCRFTSKNLDLHAGNLMMRDQTIVLTDPFWGGM